MTSKFGRRKSFTILDAENDKIIMKQKIQVKLHSYKNCGKNESVKVRLYTTDLSILIANFLKMFTV